MNIVELIRLYYLAMLEIINNVEYQYLKQFNFLGKTLKSI